MGKRTVGLTVHNAALLCTVVAAAVYLNTLDCGFCFDDMSAITENQDLRPKTPWSNLIWNDFWGTPMHIEGSHKSYRPLTVATFRLNYLLHQLQPMGYHLVNVLLHSAVCYLYVLLCASVFDRVGPALIAGLLFAVHPIHTEAVAGVVGRAETLSAIFFLLSILAYQKAVHPQKGWKQLLASLLLCFCSVLSKEQGITGVAVCLTYDIFIAQQLNVFHLLDSVSKGKVPVSLRCLLLRAFMLIGFTVTVMTLRVTIMKAELPVFTVHDNPAVAMETPYRQLHWLYLCFVNCWLLLAPSVLCADWTMGTIPLITSVTDPRNLATVMAMVTVVTLGLHGICGSKRTHKIVVLALALIIFPYIPASNLFFPVGFVVAERILYVPSMGYCILVALGVYLLFKQRYCSKFVVMVVTALILVSHSAKTLSRNRDWRSDMTLFTSAIQINPLNGKLYNNLGHEYEHLDNLTQAEGLFRTASLMQPDDIGAFINLGRVLKAQERFEEAERAYKVAVELMPKGKSFRVAPSHINVYYNLANLIKLDPSRLHEAYDLYQTALSMKPDFIEAYINKGDVLLKLNRTGDAKESFEKAIHYNPEHTDAYYNLGTTYIQMGAKRDAERCYRQALAIDGGHLYSMISLALLMHESKEVERLREAEQLLQQALAIDPNNIRITFHLALVNLDLNNIQQSEQLLLRSLQIDPNYRSALYNLGLLYSHLQRHSEAVELLERLVRLNPNHVSGIHLLGDCYMRLKQRLRAEDMYSQVLRLNPDHVNALHNLGVVKAEQGKYGDAVDLFSQALQQDPLHEAAKKHLEQAKMQLENSAKSKAQSNIKR